MAHRFYYISQNDLKLNKNFNIHWSESNNAQKITLANVPQTKFFHPSHFLCSQSHPCYELSQQPFPRKNVDSKLHSFLNCFFEVSAFFFATLLDRFSLLKCDISGFLLFEGTPKSELGENVFWGSSRVSDRDRQRRGCRFKIKKNKRNIYKPISLNLS